MTLMYLVSWPLSFFILCFMTEVRNTQTYIINDFSIQFIYPFFALSDAVPAKKGH